MTLKKDPKDLLVQYPRRRAAPGAKARAVTAARAAGQSAFTWHCPKHGPALFSTVGRCNCRQCSHDAVKAVRAKRVTLNTAPTHPVDESEQQRQNYLRFMTAKTTTKE